MDKMFDGFGGLCLVPETDPKGDRERNEKKLNYVNESNNSNVSGGCNLKGVYVYSLFKIHRFTNW